MDEFDLLQFVFPEVKLTKSIRNLLEEIRKVIVWYNLLYLEETFEPWKVYWHGLTSSIDSKSFSTLIEKMGIVGPESRKMISQKAKANVVLDALHKFKGDNYHLYTFLLPYDTEMLLYLMAKTNSEKARRIVSSFFTSLRGIKIQLNGKDLLNMGFSPGPIFKEIFNRLLEARLNDLIKTKADEIKFVEQKFGHHEP
jgi:tRNA nucleotidyltransferase (CCA-adding enzyme)